MTLQQLAEYLALLYVLALVTSHKNIIQSDDQTFNLIGDVYNKIRRSQPLTKLKISY
jgi:hypothetical protein